MSHDHQSATDHRSFGDGGLRAAVFGASDGLVSNTALVLGVASGNVEPGVVALAGVAGLLAGACSMAAGEWVSVKAQREALEGELARERDHLQRFPDEERDHMHQVLLGAGLSAELAAQVVVELEEDEQRNLQFHARMELGIDPEEMGSPIVAATSSFVAFSIGALIPLVPWLLPVGPTTLAWSLGASVVALFLVGAALARFTGRPPLWSGGRQLLIGVIATGVTMVVGSLFGSGGL